MQACYLNSKEILLCNNLCKIVVRMPWALLLVLIIIVLLLRLLYAYRPYEGYSDVNTLHSDFTLDRLKQYGNIGLSLLTADTTGALGASATPHTATPGSRMQHPLNTQPTGLFAITKTC